MWLLLPTCSWSAAAGAAIPWQAAQQSFMQVTLVAHPTQYNYACITTEQLVDCIFLWAESGSMD